MKHSFTILVLALALTASASAQEKLPGDEARQAAGKLLENYTHTDDAQIQISADSGKAAGFKGGGGGALLILDKALSAEALEKADQKIVPVGQLWMLKVAPATNGKVTANSKLRIISLGEDDKQVKLPLFLLGARKKDDQLELVIYGKGSDPLLSIPLSKSDTASTESPDLDAVKKGEDSGELTLTFPGKFKAMIKVMSQED